MEVAEFVDFLRRGHHSKPVSEVVLLQIFLRQVLEVPLRERDVGDDGDLRLVALNGHLIPQVIRLAVHLNPLVKVLLLQMDTKALAFGPLQCEKVCVETLSQILTKSFAIMIPSSTGLLQSIVNLS